MLVLATCGTLGCYSPTVRDCTVSCAGEGSCAGGQVCSFGWCAMPETSCRDVEPPLPDASPLKDAPPADAALCALGCTNGTCDASGVCVIDCSATDVCDNDVKCPPNVPCRVVCGDRSCDHKVLCGFATSCEVVCSGTDACADEIHCGVDRPCDITCSGERSCRRIKCKDACSCDATCTGAGSCMDSPECPLGTACRLGNGCSAVLPGCDFCDD